jgi:IclR family pca regulon transcriptional regulator
MKFLKREPGDRYVQSLARGLAVIRTFGAKTPHQTLSQVAAAAGLDRSAARRNLLTLEALGYARREGNNFFLTPNILDLGYSYLSSVSSWGLAERKMVELVGTVNESATLGVLTGSHIVLVACVHAENLLTINLAVGRRSPVYCTSIGRILLGGLPEERIVRMLKEAKPIKYTDRTETSIPQLIQIIERDREQGWSLVDQEYEQSVCSISVPVLSQAGQLIAAMCVVGTPIRTSREKLVHTILPHLKKAAERVWK